MIGSDCTLKQVQQAWRNVWGNDKASCHLMTAFMRVNNQVLTILVSQQETQENNVPTELNYFQAWLVVVQPYQFLVQGL